MKKMLSASIVLLGLASTALNAYPPIPDPPVDPPSVAAYPPIPDPPVDPPSVSNIEWTNI
ncbi:MAG: hypothetical protein JOY85_20105 [Acidobacteriaceae bacterium]|nr:hypothetical protein [Acidobacteriaceae bacterium]